MQDDGFRPQPKPVRRPKGKRQRLGMSLKGETLKLIYRFVRVAYLAGLAAGQGRRGRKALCERCGREVARHIHHLDGREGVKLIDPKNLSGLGDVCHRWLHGNPTQAYAEGWMKRRNQKEDP